MKHLTLFESFSLYLSMVCILFSLLGTKILTEEDAVKALVLLHQLGPEVSGDIINSFDRIFLSSTICLYKVPVMYL